MAKNHYSTLDEAKAAAQQVADATDKEVRIWQPHDIVKGKQVPQSKFYVLCYNALPPTAHCECIAKARPGV